jgi:DNA (cytosine-5)-methyltransferase 1
VLSLFSGIGGIDLGLERAGMKTVGFCEQDLFCKLILTKHWPGVPIFNDVRTVTAELVAQHCGRVDVIAGGFPCQDISYAGRGGGVENGTRSGLWREFARVVRLVRPEYVIVENVPALRGRGLGVVLSDLAAAGFDSEWDCIPAAAVRSPQRRDRIFVVSYLNRDRCEGRPRGFIFETGREELARFRRRGWAVEPHVVRMAYGFSGVVDRIKGLGNSVVPQVAEFVGRQVMRHANA